MSQDTKKRIDSEIAALERVLLTVVSLKTKSARARTLAYAVSKFIGEREAEGIHRFAMWQPYEPCADHGLKGCKTCWPEGDSPGGEP